MSTRYEVRPTRLPVSIWTEMSLLLPDVAIRDARLSCGALALTRDRTKLVKMAKDTKNLWYYARS